MKLGEFQVEHIIKGWQRDQVIRVVRHRPEKWLACWYCTHREQ